VAKSDTPGSGGPPAVLEAVAATVAEVAAGAACIGIGVPGPVSPGSGRMGPASNLTGWTGVVDVAGPVEAAIGVPVAVENDTNAAAFGEHRQGAGVGSDDLLGLWVGTGVGGGLVLDGRLRRGRGLAGEVGHLVVHPGGRRCGCGGLGHLEAYAGRNGMEREARRQHDAGRETLLVDIAGDGRMKSSVFLAALERGDDLARELLEESVEALAAAVASTALLVDIDRVVLGGGFAHRFGARFAEQVGAAGGGLLGGQAPEVVPAQLGDHSGALGAALLALDQYPRQV
jgi:glucokinase